MVKPETIGYQTETAIIKAVRALWVENSRKINEAYDEEGELSIAIAVKLGQATAKGVGVCVQMQFIKEKVKNEARFTIDEKQLGLFNPGPDSDIDSITFSTPGHDPVKAYQREKHDD